MTRFYAKCKCSNDKCREQRQVIPMAMRCELILCHSSRLWGWAACQNERLHRCYTELYVTRPLNFKPHSHSEPLCWGSTSGLGCGRNLIKQIKQRHLWKHTTHNVTRTKLGKYEGLLWGHRKLCSLTYILVLRLWFTSSLEWNPDYCVPDKT